MTKFGITAKIRWIHLNSNEIHWKVDGKEYIINLTNIAYEKVLKLYEHTPGRAFNTAMYNDLNKQSTMKGDE